MEIHEIRTEIKKMSERITQFRESLNVDKKELEIKEYDAKMQAAGFWDDQRKAQEVINAANALKDKVNTFYSLENEVEELSVAFELILEEADEDLQAELESQIQEVSDKLNKFELEILLSAPYDMNNAILELHPGAGGTESQDWAEMLYRMYTRYAERKGFKIEVLDYLVGEEAGIKSVTIKIKGTNAYGYFKAERGVHRLVRISPFDSGGRRHTSFCSCDVMPEFSGNIDIEVRAEDLKIDTYRASGAGGQHINTTDSAVRITHLPTNTIVTCQNQRSQIKNREAAMEMLKSKLYQRKLEEQEAELAKIRGEVKDIGWGSQIRSYVF
ncbi:MAG: peptide chain release factor 2, partial [Turicibacter sp.]|nr:peptide chain release factor 2 [Turicibacter sp.]